MKSRVLLLTAAGIDVDVRAIKTARSLSASGYAVTVLCGKMTGTGPDGIHARSCPLPYDSVGGVGKKLWQKLRFFMWMSREIRKVSPDVIHACNIDMLAVAWLNRGKHSRIIYDSYEICTEKEGIVSQSRWIHLIVARVEAYLIPRVDGMLCVSTAARDYFQKQYPEIRRLKVVTNAPVSHEPAVRRYELPLKVAYIGRYGKNRGIEELMDGVARLPSDTAEVLLRGFGPLETEIKSRASSQIRVLPKVRPDQIHEALQGSSVGAVLTKPTSLNHQLTVSNKIFDYIHAGLPVIMSDVEEHRRLNEKYHFGLILPEVTPESVARALTQLAEDPQAYEQFSRNACDAARELNWEWEENNLQELYREISN